MNRDGALESAWQAGMETYTSKNSNTPHSIYDVVIVGGGITGITTALQLQKAGKKCVIAEANNIGFGTTGGTTAHLNTIFDLSYDEAIKKFGEDNARLLAAAGLEAMQLIKTNVQQYEIDCDFSEIDGYLFSVEEDQDELLDKMVEATKQVGLPIEFVDESPFPIPFRKISRVEGQAQFNPIKYIYALAKIFEDNGGVILQQCRVKSIDESDTLTIHTSQGTLLAYNAVYATHIPPGVNILHFRCAPYRSYAIAVKLKNNQYPAALGYDLCEPYHYYRSEVIEGKKYLIAGGEDHKTGHEENTEQCFRRLESFVRKYFDVEEVAFKWSSQFFEPADGLPYIGHLPGNRENIFTATGFGGNGMMFGTLSAIILTDFIQKKENKYANLFEPARVKPVAGFTNFVKEAADVVSHLVGDSFAGKKIEEMAELAAGEATLVKHDGQLIAVYKDMQHQVHAVNAACTHIKCTMHWNNAELSWDCPCHGSRFSIDGELLTAPARKDLEKINLEF